MQNGRHTISELGHSGDLLGAVAVLHALFEQLAASRTSSETLRQSHPRLDFAPSEQQR